MTWIYRIGNYTLTRSQLENNALLVRQGLEKYGFTLASISGIMGNIEAESYGNPGLKDGNAWGLTQFDPYTRLTAYANLHNLNWYDGDTQLALINDEGYFTDYDGDFAKQWLPREPYKDITWDDYKALTDPELAAKVYVRNNERPAQLDYEKRARYAREWYNFYNGSPVPPDPPRPRPTFRKLPLCLLIRPPFHFNIRH